MLAERGVKGGVERDSDVCLEVMDYELARAEVNKCVQGVACSEVRQAQCWHEGQLLLPVFDPEMSEKQEQRTQL